MKPFYCTRLIWRFAPHFQTLFLPDVSPFIKESIATADILPYHTITGHSLLPFRLCCESMPPTAIQCIGNYVYSCTSKTSISNKWSSSINNRRDNTAALQAFNHIIANWKLRSWYRCFRRRWKKDLNRETEKHVNARIIEDMSSYLVSWKCLPGLVFLAFSRNVKGGNVYAAI